jgi:hypothetical protein
MRRAVEAHHRDEMGHSTHNGIQHRVKPAIISQVQRAEAAGLHNHRQGQRLRVGIGLDANRLRNTIIGQREFVSSKREDDLAGFGFHQSRNQHQI